LKVKTTNLTTRGKEEKSTNERSGRTAAYMPQKHSLTKQQHRMIEVQKLPYNP